VIALGGESRAVIKKLASAQAQAGRRNDAVDTLEVCLTIYVLLLYENIN